MTNNFWQVKKNQLNLDKGLIYGVLNLSPESFFDGDKVTNQQEIINKAKLMVAAGADVIEVGGQSTKPGFEEITVKEEIKRVTPIIEMLKKTTDLPIAIDTYKLPVMQKAIELDIDIINDINGFEIEDKQKLITEWDGGLVSMFNSRGKRIYDILFALNEFFEKQIADFQYFGIDTNRLVIDPGVGFVDSRDGLQDMEVIQNISKLLILDQPIMAAVDDKGWIKSLLGLEVDKRRIPTLIAQSFMFQHGAKIIRTHDVLATKQMLATLEGLNNES